MFSSEKDKGRIQYSPGQQLASYGLVALIISGVFFAPIAYSTWKRNQRVEAERIAALQVSNIVREERLQRFGDFGVKKRSEPGVFSKIVHFVRNYTVSGIVVDKTVSLLDAEEVEESFDQLVELADGIEWERLLEGQGSGFARAPDGVDRIISGLGFGDIFEQKSRYSPVRKPKEKSILDKLSF